MRYVPADIVHKNQQQSCESLKIFFKTINSQCNKPQASITYNEPFRPPYVIHIQ